MNWIKLPVDDAERLINLDNIISIDGDKEKGSTLTTRDGNTINTNVDFTIISIKLKAILTTSDILGNGM